MQCVNSPIFSEYRLQTICILIQCITWNVLWFVYKCSIIASHYAHHLAMRTSRMIRTYFTNQIASAQTSQSLVNHTRRVWPPPVCFQIILPVYLELRYTSDSERWWWVNLRRSLHTHIDARKVCYRSRTWWKHYIKQQYTETSRRRLRGELKCKHWAIKTTGKQCTAIERESSFDVALNWKEREEGGWIRRNTVGKRSRTTVDLIMINKIV